MLLTSTEFGTARNIFLSKLTPQLNGITVDHQCGLRHNKTSACRITSVGQVLENKWGVDWAVHQLYIDCRKKYSLFPFGGTLYSVRWEFHKISHVNKAMCE
jgi:hypothetical protein